MENNKNIERMMMLEGIIMADISVKMMISPVEALNNMLQFKVLHEQYPMEEPLEQHPSMMIIDSFLEEIKTSEFGPIVDEMENKIRENLGKAMLEAKADQLLDQAKEELD